MRLLRAPLTRSLLVATVAGLALSAAPAEAGSTAYSASYTLKAGARSGTSETARDIADVRRAALASSVDNQLRVVVTADEVPAQSSRIDGVYSVELEFAGGDVQTITYSTDTVSVTGSLVVASGLLDVAAEADLTLRRGRVAVSGEGCARWTATVDHRADTIAFESRSCVGLRMVDEITVEAVAVTTADKRVGYDASGDLRHDVRIH